MYTLDGKLITEKEDIAWRHIIIIITHIKCIAVSQSIIIMSSSERQIHLRYEKQRNRGLSRSSSSLFFMRDKILGINTRKLSTKASCDNVASSEKGG